MAKTLTEEIFGGVSDCKGMCTGGDNRGTVSAEARERFSNPRYHEGEQVDSATVVTDDGPITEEMLCSHF